MTSIIFSRTVEEHLSDIKQVFKKLKLRNVKTLNEIQQMPLLHKRNTTFRMHSQHQGHPSITFKGTSHPEHAPTPEHPNKFVPSFGLVGYYRKFIKDFHKNS